MHAWSSSHEAEPSGKLSRFESLANLPQPTVTGPRAAWPVWPGKMKINSLQRMTVTTFPTGTRRWPQCCLKLNGRAHWANAMANFLPNNPKTKQKNSHGLLRTIAAGRTL
jgi:hypothetical protein